MTVEQDGEYLHDAHQIIAEELACGGPVEDELDAATAVIDGLHARGWALVSEADFDVMVGAYTLQEIRGGRVTVAPSEAKRVCRDCKYELAENEYHTLDRAGGHQPPDCLVHFRGAGYEQSRGDAE